MKNILSIAAIALTLTFSVLANDLQSPKANDATGSQLAGLTAPALSFDTWFCLSQGYASWTAVAGATYYDLYMNGAKVKTVTGTSTFWQNGSGDLTVRARNSTSVSAHSNVEYVPYYNICM